VQGFFGKLPSHGDFVTRNLSRGFIDTWDDWLQRAVATSKASLGEAWLNTYLTSPIWRFVLVPGVCGESGWAGILVPSVDRVGRYFPLTVAASFDSGVQPFHVASCAESWFEAAENLALQVLEQDKFDADQLASAVEVLDEAPLQVEGTAPLVGGGEWGLRIQGGTGAGQAVSHAVSHQLVQFQVGRYSLWWNPGSEEQQPMALVAPELPNPDCFAELLSGTWGASLESETLTRTEDDSGTVETSEVVNE